MIEDTLNFAVGLFVLLVLAIMFTVIVNGYLSPTFKGMYYQVPEQGLSYSAYSSVLSRLSDTLEIVFFILIGGSFLYLLLKMFYKKEEEVYEV